MAAINPDRVVRVSNQHQVTGWGDEYFVGAWSVADDPLPAGCRMIPYLIDLHANDDPATNGYWTVVQSELENALAHYFPNADDVGEVIWDLEQQNPAYANRRSFVALATNDTDLGADAAEAYYQDVLDKSRAFRPNVKVGFFANLHLRIGTPYITNLVSAMQAGPPYTHTALSIASQCQIVTTEVYYDSGETQSTIHTNAETCVDFCNSLNVPFFCHIWRKHSDGVTQHTTAEFLNLQVLPYVERQCGLLYWGQDPLDVGPGSFGIANGTNLAKLTAAATALRTRAYTKTQKSSGAAALTAFKLFKSNITTK